MRRDRMGPKGLYRGVDEKSLRGKPFKKHSLKKYSRSLFLTLTIVISGMPSVAASPPRILGSIFVSRRKQRRIWEMDLHFTCEGRQAGRQADREADRQTDRQTDRKTDVINYKRQQHENFTKLMKKPVTNILASNRITEN